MHNYSGYNKLYALQDDEDDDDIQLKILDW